MRLVSFIEPFLYDPTWLVRDPRLLKRLEPFDAITRAAFAEQFVGNLKKHVFYAVRQDNDVTAPTTDSPDVIPHLVNQSAAEAAELMPPGGQIVVSTEGPESGHAGTATGPHDGRSVRRQNEPCRGSCRCAGEAPRNGLRNLQGSVRCAL